MPTMTASRGMRSMVPAGGGDVVDDAGLERRLDYPGRQGG
jgi:hypothetical protein